VREIGAGVTAVKPGDHVIPLYTPECRQCKTCLSRKTRTFAPPSARRRARALMPDGTVALLLARRPARSDVPLHGLLRPSRTSRCCPRSRWPRSASDAPFDKVCYIGCGVTTGIGAVINTAKVEPGANVVVFGLGGIGLNVIQGAQMVGADKIIGIDINPARAGAWRAEVRHDALHQPRRRCDGNVVRRHRRSSPTAAPTTASTHRQHQGDAPGAGVHAIAAGAESSSSAWPEAGQEIATRPFQLVTGRSLEGHGLRRRARAAPMCRRSSTGTWTARSISTISSPMSCRSTQINTAFDLMHEGKSIRSVIVY